MNISAEELRGWFDKLKLTNARTLDNDQLYWLFEVQKAAEEIAFDNLQRRLMDLEAE